MDLSQVSALDLVHALYSVVSDGSFIRLYTTSDDLSVAINGVHIARVSHASNLAAEFSRPEVTQRVVAAANNYSDAKVARLLKYSPVTDYRLQEFPNHQEKQRRPNPYYVYYHIMGMQIDEFKLRNGDIPDGASNAEILARKKEVITSICLENGISQTEVPNGYGFRRLKREIETVCSPLIKGLREKVPGDILEIMVDAVAQRYTPESANQIKEGVKRAASVLEELYSRSKRYGILMPKDEQLVTFFAQIVERAFGEKKKPLAMFVVACPRYGEHDEYDKLEEGVSLTARTYLDSLPLLTGSLTKNDIPYQGYILVNDTEEQMADGSLLDRFGLTKETYRARCRGNVAAISQAIGEDERITNVSAHLFTEIFPEFVNVTADLERQLYHLTQNDPNLRLEMAKVADARLTRHTKIMGGKCDFSDSLYLALHYSAEYMALGYLCRMYPELSTDSFIVNYNSPNVEQFNSQELLLRCTRGNSSADAMRSIPVFQVKFY